MTLDGELLAPGERLDKFEIEGELGQGGFGVTYLARHRGLLRRVAIKEYLPRDWGMRLPDGTVGPRTRSDVENYEWGLRRFLEEAQTLAQFDHPNIMRVYDVLEQRGTAYLVSEYVEGPDGEARSLADELKATGTLSEGRVRELLDALTTGLGLVHAAGLVHRDIKPANIMLERDGAPVLIDFGAARQTISLQSKSAALTQVLTPKYAPIEQYSSRGHQGPWTDIYSLGAVAYFALTGRPPDDATERVRSDRLAPVRVAAAQPVSRELATAVEAALAVNESDRPQSLDEWRVLLAEPPARSPVGDPPPPPVGEDEIGAGVEVRGRRAWVYAAAAALVGIAVAVAVMQMGGAVPAVVDNDPREEVQPGGTPPGDETSPEDEAPPGDEASPEDEAPPEDEASPADEASDDEASPDDDRRPRPDRRAQELDRLLAAAVEAETRGELEQAIRLYGDALSLVPGNRLAAQGRERVRAIITQNDVREHLRQANDAFLAGRYDDARGLFQAALDLGPSPEAVEGLQRVDNIEALACTDEATCGTLVVRVEPDAEIAVDGRALGIAAGLELRVTAGRYLIELETEEWRYPRMVDVVAGETVVREVDLELDGRPK